MRELDRWWCGISLILYITNISTASQTALNSGRLLTSLLGYPETCVFRGAVHACTLSLACWLVGGKLESGCGTGDVIADWLFTCCIPAKMKLQHHWPIRRGDTGMSLHTQECGVPLYSLQKRIIGGDEAYFGEFPWQAHIRIADYQCGGVLVNHQYVATAAHCIHRAKLGDIVVFLGEYDTQNTGQYLEPYPEEIHRVVKKIIHPSFQYRISQPDRFDIALIRLSRFVLFRENILPICLPVHGTSFKDKTGVVVGWGKTDTSYGKTGTNILHKASVPILTDEECLQWHKHKSITVELHREMFCAGHRDGHMDACLGDSGGPLIVFDTARKRWILAGITSAGFGCAVDHQPGIYHKVTLTADWIASNINK